jgi:hypothetical protein
MSEAKRRPQTLRSGSLVCPECKGRLHFEQIAGMRVYHERQEDKRNIFSAVCPPCSLKFEVYR